MLKVSFKRVGKEKWLKIDFSHHVMQCIRLFVLALWVHLSGCTVPLEPLIVPDRPYSRHSLFMPPRVHQQLRWDIQTFLREKGIDKCTIDRRP